MCDILTIDDSDEEVRIEPQQTTTNKCTEEIVLSDSSDDSDDIIVEALVNNCGIEYIGRKNRPVFRPNRRKDLTETVDPENFDNTNDQSLQSLDSNQSHSKSIANSFISEKRTPTKITSNSYDKSFKPAVQSSSSQPSIEPQTSNQINCSDISSTVPVCDESDTYRSPNVSSISDSSKVSETSFDDIGVEPDDTNSTIDVSVKQFDTTLNISERFQPQFGLSSNRTSTPIHSLLFNETIDQSMDSPSKQTTDSNERPNNLNLKKVIKNKSINGNKNDKNQKQAFRTEDLMNKLSLNECKSNSSQTKNSDQEVYICTYEGCGQEFNAALLHYKHEKKHLRELISVGVKTFKCYRNDCNWKGFTQIELMCHNSTHFGRFVCPKSGCIYQTLSQNQLNIHMKRHRIA